MWRRVAVAGWLAGAVVTASSCNEVASSAGSNENAGLAVLAFHNALADQNSLGKLHNVELDSIHSRIHAERSRLGRRIKKSEMCKIFQTYMADRVQQGAAPPSRRLSPQMERNRHRKSCDLSAGAPTAASGVRSTAASIAASYPVDWVDSVFVSEWDDSEFSLPLPDDDMATIEAAVNAVTAAMQGQTSTSGVQTAISAAVSAMNPTDEEAELIGVVAAFGVESTMYWEENGQEWLEDFCEEEDPPANNVAVQGADGCDIVQNSIGLNSLADGDMWGWIIEAGTADVTSVWGLGATIVEGAKGAYAFWERGGRTAGGASASFRASVKSAVDWAQRNRGDVIRTAGKFFRSSSFATIAAASAIDSGFAVMN